ncbi:VOC family protein [uncultured Roseovarius sp.]|uniref:VOC family protein n=1 Tax=uncultured Roseovarius sp. TaxID=293344 RepID=UPI00263283ED|nr:VOC family protein [uncultured Roseovarius sp.]
MAPRIDRIDHLVLTVADITATIAFYRDALGMDAVVFHPSDGTTRHALRFGTHKINLHPAGAEYEPKASHPRPGSADLCFLSPTPLAEWQAHLARLGVPVEQGPVDRSGAVGSLLSIYLRDPDGNLIEISNQQ